MTNTKPNYKKNTLIIALCVITIGIVYFFFFSQPQEFQRIQITYDGSKTEITQVEPNYSKNKRWALFQPTPLFNIINNSEKDCSVDLKGKKTDLRANVRTHTDIGLATEREHLSISVCDTSTTFDPQ